MVRPRGPARYRLVVLIRCQHCRDRVEAEARFCGLCGATIVDPNIGRVVGRRYALRERIGSGSLGIVYRAEQLGVGRKLAIKLLPAEADRQERQWRGFGAKASSCASCARATPITTYEFDREDDNSLYIAMELSPGRSLADVFRSEGPLESKRVLRILIDLCDSLAEAHALGVVHRDLKPENILIEERQGRDFAKLSDFGLAKLLPANTHLSAPGQAIGAIEFSSPEQLLHHRMDARSDLYGLGTLAYLLITGKHPFHDVRSVADMVEAHVKRFPPPASSLRSDVPTDVDAILARLLAKDPHRRFPDAVSLAALLGIVLSTVLPGDPTETIREPDLGEEDTALGEIPRREDLNGT